MRFHIILAATALFAAPSVYAQEAPAYEARLDFLELAGADKEAYIFVVPVTVTRDASMDAGREPLDGSPLTGGLRRDDASGQMKSELTICRPKLAECEPVATPNLVFEVGEEASFHVAGPQYSMTLTLRPVSDTES